MVRVLKPTADWTSQAFLNSAKGVPITLEHPRDFIDVRQSKKDVRGIGDSIAATVAGDGRVMHGATVFDAELIAAVQGRDIRSVSGGYSVRWEAHSGVWTARDGTKMPYDAVQYDPVLNHVAATRSPRVKNADILLDSESSAFDALWLPTWDNLMDPKLIELLDKIRATDSVAADALRQLVDAKSKELTELRASFDATRAERDTLKGQLAAAPTQDSIVQSVRAHVGKVAAIATKSGIAIDALVDAKDEREMYARALKHLNITVDANESVDYMRCALDLNAKAPNRSASDAIARQTQATDAVQNLEVKIREANAKIAKQAGKGTV